MKKENAFTLIELLAVIIILAIIAIIATPIAINIIEDTKKNAFKNTAYGLIDAMKLKYAENYLKEHTGDLIYTFPNTTGLSFKGKLPDGGVIRLTDKGKVSLAVYNDKWCAVKGLDASEVTLTDYVEGKCILQEEADVPIITLNGEEIIYLSLGKTYTEPGYSVKTVGGIELANNTIKTSVTGQTTGASEIDTNIEEIYTITYTVTYNGNTTSVSRIIHVGNYKPTIQIEPNGTNTYQQEEELTIQVSAFEKYNIDGFTYTIIKDNIEGNAINIDSLTKNLTLTENGIYKIKVIATDSEGNTNEYISNEYKIDNTPPEITFTEDEKQGLVINKSEVTTYDLLTGVNVSDNSNTVNLDQVKVSGDLSTYVGYDTIQYEITDEAGNKTTKNRKITIINDTTLSEGLHITEVRYESDINANITNTELQAYNTTLESNIVLSNEDPNSEITFLITIFNNTNYDYILSETNYDNLLNNSNIVMQVINNNGTNVITSKNSNTFQMTFKYKNGISPSEDINELIYNIDIILSKCYKVTYENITINNLPNYAEENKTLTIEFKELDAPIEVSINGQLLTENQYNYTNYTLKLTNVSGDIHIRKQNKYTIKNLVLNGSFENALTNWTINGSSSYWVSTDIAHFGSNAYYRKASGLAAHFLTQKITWTNKHKYYFFAYTVSTSEQPFACDITNKGGPISIYTTKSYQKGSTIYESNFTGDNTISINYGQTTDIVIVDGVGIIDLTQSFGAGNEPNKEWCDQNIEYFDGTKIIYK